MANESMSIEQVKSVVNSLECSPSKHDASGNYGGKPSISPTAKNSVATSGSEHTSEFKHSGPSYRGKYAKGARQE